MIVPRLDGDLSDEQAAENGFFLREETFPLNDEGVRWQENHLYIPEDIVRVVDQFFALTLVKGVSDATRVILGGTLQLLLTGLPGTGKSTLLRSRLNHIARENHVRVRVLYLDPARIFSADLGQSGKNVTAFLSRVVALHKAGNAVAVWAEELDGIGIKRDLASKDANPIDVVHVTNGLLVGLDKLASLSQFAVVATSNHAHLIDSALMDRFGLSLHLPLPDGMTRARILCDSTGGTESRLCMDAAEKGPDVILRTQGWSGRSLVKRLVVTAMVLRCKQPHELICQDLLDAMNLLQGEHK